MRMLPMQMTDVVVSIASGMPIWLVAIQQGGQIKDSFGGISNALKAIRSQISPTTAAFVGVAGILALIAKAAADADAENRKFSGALILTGNAAGSTVQNLKAISDAVSESANVTRGFASDVVVALARTGDLSEKEIGRIAASVAKFSDASGVAADDIAKDFEKIGKSPVSALAELNDKYNFKWSLDVYDVVDMTYTANTAVITPKQQGQCTLTVSHPKCAYPQQIIIKVSEYTSFGFGITSKTITEGKSTFINMQVPVTALDTHVEYSSTSPKVASVQGTDSVCQLTGVAPGTTTIKAKQAGISAICLYQLKKAHPILYISRLRQPFTLLKKVRTRRCPQL